MQQSKHVFLEPPIGIEGYTSKRTRSHLFAAALPKVILGPEPSPIEARDL